MEREDKTKNLILEILEVLQKYNLISFYDVRNYKIKLEFDMLVKSGIKSTEAKEKISDKYFIGIKNLEKIIYKKSFK